VSLSRKPKYLKNSKKFQKCSKTGPNRPLVVFFRVLKPLKLQYRPKSLLNRHFLLKTHFFTRGGGSREGGKGHVLESGGVSPIPYPYPLNVHSSSHSNGLLFSPPPPDELTKDETNHCQQPHKRRLQNVWLLLDSLALHVAAAAKFNARSAH
jgi:hypothetical protein